MSIKKKKETSQEERKEKIEINTTELTAPQIRAIRTFNALLTHTLSTKSEEEYFDSAAELMRICASLIKQANFTSSPKNNIPYAKQALEYSIDILQGQMNSSKVITYDN